MAPTPATHPLRVRTHNDLAARQRAIRLHPSGRSRAVPASVPTVRTAAADPTRRPDPDRAHEAGSMTTEYGLIVVVGATVCSLVIKWASSGAVFELLAGILTTARGLVGL